MSKKVIYLPGGVLQTVVDDERQCKHMCDEVCCNNNCKMYGDYVDAEYCQYCDYFEPEG